MLQANVALVQRGLEHFMATGEVPWELFHENVEVYDHDTPDQGAYRGHEGYGRWLEDWGAAWAEWTIEPEEYIDADDAVVVFLRMKTKGRGSGVEVERQDALVHKLCNGKVVRADYYNDRKQALAAVRLEEE
jgi:ketosteroid isomerase-like protein